MLRRQARLRREYLYRKSSEEKQKNIQAKKDQLKRSLEENIPIHGDLRKEAIALQKRIEYEDKGPERAAVIGGFSGGANTLNSQDDEYRYAGVEDPKIMITTSREPSARLKMFVKELRLIFPNSQRMNRGGYEMSQLIHACRANDVTDFIVVHEHRGVPDSLVICHLPYGPTASFTLSGVVMRHDIPDIGPMSEQYPHLIFHNFKTDLGLRTMSILKYLFPVPKADSKRVITFANNDDYICFRQHIYKKVCDMPVPDFLKEPLTLYELAEQYWDLRAYPTQYVFSLLALVSDDKLERDKCMELSSPEGQEDWLNYSRRPKRTVLEVLHDFHKSTSKLTIEIIFELFCTIKPRSFSIASSCLTSRGTRIDILVAVVKYYSKLKKPRLGLASNWLKCLRVGDKVYGWIKMGSLKFPTDTHKIKEYSQDLWHLINDKGAYIYISGNAKNMPDNVREAFIEDVFSKEGKLDLDQAKAMLASIERDGRLQVETW
ncbi:jg20961 [Pararge aegeria aegeria]|uniref:Jg20961 protein n=1 Tax=Pararge aegeria aegeria TaxID=348720 RepID=A0A8S4RDD5_9NEOP|nr:jg20961 [Pararge aegeria aegeria]